MARHTWKLALGLALLGALALAASAQVDSVENLVPTFNDRGLPVNRNAPFATQTNPGIAIETDVKNTTAPNGAPAYPAYFGAGSTPGIYLTNRTNAPSNTVQYRFKVFNTGRVTLKNIKVTVENVLNRAVLKTWTIPEIRSGRSATLYLQVPFALGQQGVNGKVSVVYNGRSLTANNRAHYFGVRPRIWLSKAVQNATLGWEAADTEATAVHVTQDPVFLYQVKNTGNFALTNVRVIDAQLGTINLNITSLAVNQIVTFNRTGTFVAGLSNNSAQARGMFVNPNFPTRSEQAFATNLAWTFGKEDGGPPANPDLTFYKLVYNVATDQYLDANTEPEAVEVEAGTSPLYVFRVVNTGNVDLTDVTFVDPALGDLSSYTIPSLAVGEDLTVPDTIPGNPTQDTDVGNFITNEAYATALYGTTPVTSNKDTAVITVVAAPYVDPEDPEYPPDYPQ